MPIIKRLWPLGHSFERHLVHIFCEVPIGASGAPGTHVGKGVTVTRTGAGLYTATIDGSGGVGQIFVAGLRVVRDDAAGYIANVRTVVESTRVITFETCTNAAPDTAADPPSGALIQLHLVVRNSSSANS